MIKLFPAKCREEILHCGSSVWAAIVMKHHNTPTKHAMSLVHFVFICKHLQHTIVENEVYQTQFHEEVAMKFVENAGKVTKW
jgi:hypothetical protein